MGQTNRKKFEDLLAEVSNNRQQNNTDGWNDSTDQIENNNQEEKYGSQQLGIVEVDKTSHRLTDYDASWKPVTTHNISKGLLQMNDRTLTDLSDVELPKSFNPSPKEIGRFLYLLEECSHVQLPSKADSNQISISELTSKHHQFTFNNQFGTHLDTIKLIASILENQSIPWTLSEITEKKHNESNMHHVIVEAGVPETEEGSQEEFIGELGSVMPETIDSHTVFIESTHSENGSAFYPVYGQFLTVHRPGIMKRNEVLVSNSANYGIKHRGIIKSSFPEQ